MEKLIKFLEKKTKELKAVSKRIEELESKRAMALDPAFIERHLDAEEKNVRAIKKETIEGLSRF